jgi:hypothetical protein
MRRQHAVIRPQQQSARLLADALPVRHRVSLNIVAGCAALRNTMPKGFVMIEIFVQAALMVMGWGHDRATRRFAPTRT